MTCPASTVLVLAGTTSQGWPYGDQIPFTLPATSAIRFRWSATPAVAGLTWRFLNSAGDVVAETPDTLPPAGLTSPFTLPAGNYILWLTTAAESGVGANAHPVDQTVVYSITGTCTTLPPPKPTGLHVVSVTETSVTLACNDMGAGLTYAWFNGAARVGDFTSTPTTVITGLAADTAYTLGCETVVPGQLPWSLLATVSARTASGGGSPPPPPASTSSLVPVLAVAGVALGGIWLFGHHAAPGGSGAAPAPSGFDATGRSRRRRYRRH
jgi:hypothetical protein